jgi:hypothetical protein
MTIHKTTLRCGDTLHVLVAGSADELARLVERESARLLKANGHAVVAADGSGVWVSDEEIHPSQWDATGNRIRANRVRHERSAEGLLTSRTIRTVWIEPT